MPSKRPSPSALDQSPVKPHHNPTLVAPKSKRRTSRPKPSSSHMNPSSSSQPPQNPNPNPNPSPPPPSRKSERKRKPRSFPDAKPANPTGVVQKLWTDADEVALLTGASAFRSRTGSVPRLPDMPALFDSIKSSLSPHLDQAKVYYKLKRLKSKFLHTAPASGSSSPHDRRVRDLSADVWGLPETAPRPTPLSKSTAIDLYINGADDAPEERDQEEDGDGEEEVRYPVVSEVLEEYWRKEGSGVSEVAMRRGVKVMDREDGRAMEAKWRRQMEAEMRIRMRRHDVAKEVYGLLVEAVKGLGP